MRRRFAALTLIDLFPAQRDEILKRAAEFARNREVCGVHHPSDIEAGKKVAEKLYEKLKVNPVFTQEFKPKCRLVGFLKGSAEFRDKLANPHIAASRGFIDEIIQPRTTRPKPIAALARCENKRDRNPPKKHGNIPL